MTSPVGTYAISGSGTTIASPAGRSYRIVHVPGTLTITPRSLVVTANDARRRQGQPNPSFTFRLNGLVAGDTADVVRGLQLLTSATEASSPGGYSITPVGGSADNYTLVRLPGFLLVLPTSAETEQGIAIGTSNTPPPSAWLGPRDGGIQLAAGRPGAAVPLQAASNACGAGAGMDILRCATGFPTQPN